MPTLYVVATPIGNLGDMSPRAIQTLQSVALIAAEDTRVTQKLLSAFAIHTPLTSYHAHNERNKAESLISRMVAESMDMALTTDAGTPCISDPGAILVAEAQRQGVEVIAVAGPCAMAAALSISGFPVTEWGFVGFLPRNKKELGEKLLDIAVRMPVAIAHESPHRIITFLEVLSATLPNTNVSVSCDLTKKHELTLRGSVAEVLTALQNNPKANKGEYCVVLCFASEDIPKPKATTTSSLPAQLVEEMLQGASLREAMGTLVARGERKNAVYTASLQLKEVFQCN